MSPVARAAEQRRALHWRDKSVCARRAQEQSQWRRTQCHAYEYAEDDVKTLGQTGWWMLVVDKWT